MSEEIVHKKWQVRPLRGLDHWEYAICDEYNTNLIIANIESQRIAEHIVVLHNQFVDDYIAEMGC